MDTGRVIHRRYLLQRLIKRGAACAIYQGFDQVLQRAVVVKAVPAEHISAYRAAIRTTSQFAHPNIIGIFDLIIEPETIYIVQEYVEGDDFPTLLKSQLVPQQVADLGMQICQALLYACTASRKISHGDLTPSSLVRDRRGLVRVNNFALPSDDTYFIAWSSVGGNGPALADPELPYGQMSDGRRADDTRAVGILLYQLLAGRSNDAPTVEPPVDGRLRFLRNVPPELCEIIARAVVRMHPQHINTPEVLHAELKTLSEALDPALQPSTTGYPAEDFARPQQFSASSSVKLAAQIAQRENTTAESALMLRSDTKARIAAMEPASPAAATMADMSMKLAAARQAAYSNLPDIAPPTRRINLPVLLLVGLVLFALFFGIGYILANVFIH